ncbi:GDSL-type esterase/lipase family protein [Sinorhizobium fredii]|uniref:GDSL-type esterase/lipase family protein n=1 Tax=Rhizobium fredii TaxID=380 RepID=UPI0035147CF8
MAAIDMSGDSITVGVGVTTAQRYATLLANSLSRTIVSRAKSGDMAADQAQKAISQARASTSIATIMVGTNDERVYGTSSVRRGYYIAFLRRLVLDAAAPVRKTGRSTAVAKVGTWFNTQVNTIGITTTQKGAKATATVSGTAVYIGTILQNHPSARGVAQVKIDGQIVGTVSSDGTGGMNTYNGLSYGSAAFRFGGLSNGTHKVELTVTSASGQNFRLDYISGNGGQAGVKTFVSNIIRKTAYGYAKVGGSDANVSAYNADIATLISTLDSDSLGVYLVNNWSGFNPATHLLPDGVHPNPAGHSRIYSTFRGAILAHI